MHVLPGSPWGGYRGRRFQQRTVFDLKRRASQLDLLLVGHVDLSVSYDQRCRFRIFYSDRISIRRFKPQGTFSLFTFSAFNNIWLLGCWYYPGGC